MMPAPCPYMGETFCAVRPFLMVNPETLTSPTPESVRQRLLSVWPGLPPPSMIVVSLLAPRSASPEWLAPIVMFSTYVPGSAHKVFPVPIDGYLFRSAWMWRIGEAG